MIDPLLKKSVAEGDKIILVCKEKFEPAEKTGKDGEKFWCYSFEFTDLDYNTYKHFATHGEYYYGKGGGTIPLEEVFVGQKLEAVRVGGSYPHFQFYPL